MARKFFYVCAGMFLLALSYHLGASTVNAQQSTQIVGIMYDQQNQVVITSSGDVYSRRWAQFDGSPPVYWGSFWGGTPVDVKEESWGALKQRFR